MTVRWKPNRWWILKPAVFLACLAPAVWLAWAAMTGNLSANPVDDITDATGRWTLRFLLITLAITPLRRIASCNSLIRLRRMTGLFAFFYSVLHLIRYVWLDHLFAWDEMAQDIVKRPYITAGLVSFIAMIPLAVTSTKNWIARLGGKRWQRLHRLIYISTGAGVLHYLWLVKLDIQRPAAYGVVLGVLLGARVLIRLHSRRVAVGFSPRLR